MASKLAVYNGALRLCKERRLAALTDSIESRRLLDDAYGDGSTVGAVAACLQMGQWTFATRAARVEYDASIDPDFGYIYAFGQPSDVVRVTAVCEDEYYQQPLLKYVDERGYWYAAIDTIYVKYVSSHASYGADLSLWPESFAKLVEAYLAKEIVGSLTADEKIFARVWKIYEAMEKKARGLDAMNKPTVFAPVGSWTRSRHGGHVNRSGWNEQFS